MEQDPAQADVLRGWVEAWSPRADAAIAGLAPLFAVGGSGVSADEVVAAAAAARDRQLGACGL